MQSTNIQPDDPLPRNEFYDYRYEGIIVRNLLDKYSFDPATIEDETDFATNDPRSLEVTKRIAEELIKRTKTPFPVRIAHQDGWYEAGLVRKLWIEKNQLRGLLDVGPIVHMNIGAGQQARLSLNHKQWWTRSDPDPSIKELSVCLKGRRDGTCLWLQGTAEPPPEVNQQEISAAAAIDIPSIIAAAVAPSSPVVMSTAAAVAAPPSLPPATTGAAAPEGEEKKVEEEEEKKKKNDDDDDDVDEEVVKPKFVLPAHLQRRDGEPPEEYIQRITNASSREIPPWKKNSLLVPLAAEMADNYSKERKLSNDRYNRVLQDQVDTVIPYITEFMKRHKVPDNVSRVVDHFKENGRHGSAEDEALFRQIAIRASEDILGQPQPQQQQPPMDPREAKIQAQENQIAELMKQLKRKKRGKSEEEEAEEMARAAARQMNAAREQQQRYVPSYHYDQQPGSSSSSSSYNGYQRQRTNDGYYGSGGGSSSSYSMPPRQQVEIAAAASPYYAPQTVQPEQERTTYVAGRPVYGNDAYALTLHQMYKKVQDETGLKARCPPQWSVAGETYERNFDVSAYLGMSSSGTSARPVY